MNTRLSYTSIGMILMSQAIPLVAHCEVYLSEEQATKSLFPGEKFTKQTIPITPEEIQLIEDKSGQKVRSNSAKTWVSTGKKTVFIDQVLGKHEMITYAVGINPDGKVQGIEILEYRETYGQQVKGDGWRKQFVGKTTESPLKVGADIVNISGATLSSAHVTAGVKRILQTYDKIKTRI